MIVRWGLDALPEVCAEIGVHSPLLVASPRWDGLELPVAPHGRWSEVPSDRIDAAVAEARAGDGVLAVGGGSAIDLGKALSAAAELPLVSVPTTYSGAEWTTYYGIRNPERRMRGGGANARPTGIVYDAELTLDLSRETTVGTALNALAHCAEALYAHGHDPAADEEALAGARLISEWLPRVVDAPTDLEARTRTAPWRLSRRGRSRRLDAGACACDGAGRRRPLRAPARDAERDLPAARAPLQCALRTGARPPLRRCGRE